MPSLQCEKTIECVCAPDLGVPSGALLLSFPFYNKESTDKSFLGLYQAPAVAHDPEEGFETLGPEDLRSKLFSRHDYLRMALPSLKSLL